MPIWGTGEEPPRTGIEINAYYVTECIFQQLIAHNWQNLKKKKSIPTCPHHKIYKVESVNI